MRYIYLPNHPINHFATNIALTLLMGFFLVSDCNDVCLAQPNVVTWHNDSARTGRQPNEIALTPATVSPTTFGKLWSFPIDGYAYVQPLFVSSVYVPGKGLRNVVYVATEHNSVYAFDADSNTGSSAQPLWKVNFNNPTVGVNPMPATDVPSTSFTLEVGITGTPVIDLGRSTIYFVVKTKEVTGGVTRYVQRLHALDIASGAARPGSPVEIQAKVPGVGTGNDGLGNVVFSSRYNNQRPGLALHNGTVFVGWAAHGDYGETHGWIMGFDADTLAQNRVFCASPDAQLATIWMSGAAPAIDLAGNLYIETGNGPLTAHVGGRDYGDSFLKLATTGGILTVADFFAPYNQAYLNSYDIDLGAGAPVLLPDEAGSTAHPRLLVGAGKDGTVYLLDRDNLGHFNPAGDTNIVQSLPNVLGPVRSVAAYFDNQIFFAAYTDVLKAYSIVNGRMSDSPVRQSTWKFEYPGSTPSVSYNQNAVDPAATGVIWVIDPGLPTGGLIAYRPSDLTTPLYNSRTIRRGDDSTGYVKFSVPTVANGKVFVGGRSTLTVYGLGSWVPNPSINPPTGNYVGTTMVQITTSLPGAEIHYTLNGTEPTRSSPIYAGPFQLDRCTRVKAIAFKSGYRDSGVTESFLIIDREPGQGDGLFGSYFPTTNLTGSAVTRIDPFIDFHWKDIPPISGIPQNYFSVRWTGAIEPPCGDTYTFYLNSDDGARLWIDGKQVISNWTSHNETESSAKVVLESGRRYAVKLEFWQQAFHAVAQLRWSVPGLDKTVVPTNRLYSGPFPVTLVPLASSAIGPRSLAFTVTTNRAAPPEGAIVSFSSDSDAISVPVSVTLPPGASSVVVNGTVNPVTADRIVVVNATINGVSASGKVTVKAPTFNGLSVSPSSLIGGSAAVGKVVLTGPTAVGAGAKTIILSSTGPITVPPSIAIPEGSSLATFPVTTLPVGVLTTANISGTLDLVSRSANVNVKPADLASIALTPASAVGGSTMKLTVKLTGAAAAPITVLISTTVAAAHPPASVVIPVGANNITVTFSTTAVAANQTGTMTAQLGTVSKVANLTVKH